MSPLQLAGLMYQQDVDPDLLDLRWSPDEVDWLTQHPTKIWVSWLNDDFQRSAEMARHYALDDPYGAREAAPIISDHFGCKLAARQVAFGAGVGALLQQLAAMSRDGSILAPPLTHPDLPAWALARGGCVLPMTGRSAIFSENLALVHIDRPSIRGDVLALDAVIELAMAAHDVGAVLSIDETYCSYLQADQSAVPLVSRVDNLVVLRGISKAYCSGGLRVGFAVTSPAISLRLRQYVCPLQVSYLAFKMALQLIGAGDIFTNLRLRIREIKPEIVESLTAAGFEAIAGHSELPWLLIRDHHGDVIEKLAHAGILGKPVEVCHELAGGPVPLIKLSIPLSEHRFVAFCRRVQRS